MVNPSSIFLVPLQMISSQSFVFKPNVFKLTKKPSFQNGCQYVVVGFVVSQKIFCWVPKLIKDSVDSVTVYGYSMQGLLASSPPATLGGK
jgi:hypothetical protein